VRVNSREKLVRVSYRLAARYFSRQFLASNRVCSISCKFLVRVFGASFSYEFLVRLSWALGWVGSTLLNLQWVGSGWLTKNGLNGQL